ncbi:MAG: heavy metal-responsive transcriptional regulator [Thermomonas sp.]
MRIGHLADKAGVAVDTVRYYERQGLLPPPARRPSGYRDYGNDELQQLRFVRRCKALGFTLEETRELLRLNADPKADRTEVRALTERRLADVDAKLHELQALRDSLAELASSCSGQGPLEGCPIIHRVLGAMPEVSR